MSFDTCSRFGSGISVAQGTGNLAFRLACQITLGYLTNISLFSYIPFIRRCRICTWCLGRGLMPAIAIFLLRQPVWLSEWRVSSLYEVHCRWWQIGNVYLQLKAEESTELPYDWLTVSESCRCRRVSTSSFARSTTWRSCCARWRHR